MPLDEAIVFRAVFVIVYGSDERTERNANGHTPPNSRPLAHNPGGFLAAFLCGGGVGKTAVEKAKNRLHKTL